MGLAVDMLMPTNPDGEPYYYGVMEDVEGIPWNFNPEDELRYKHLTNGVKIFMPFLGPTYHFCILLKRLDFMYRVLAGGLLLN